jgi:hypothetical protein
MRASQWHCAERGFAGRLRFGPRWAWPTRPCPSSTCPVVRPALTSSGFFAPARLKIGAYALESIRCITVMQPHRSVGNRRRARTTSRFFAMLRLQQDCASRRGFGGVGQFGCGGTRQAPPDADVGRCFQRAAALHETGRRRSDGPCRAADAPVHFRISHGLSQRFGGL